MVAKDTYEPWRVDGRCLATAQATRLQPEVHARAPFLPQPGTLVSFGAGPGTSLSVPVSTCAATAPFPRASRGIHSSLLPCYR